MEAREMVAILARNLEMRADFATQYEIGMAGPVNETPRLDGLAALASFVLLGAVPLVPCFAAGVRA